MVIKYFKNKYNNQCLTIKIIDKEQKRNAHIKQKRENNKNINHISNYFIDDDNMIVSREHYKSLQKRATSPDTFDEILSKDEKIEYETNRYNMNLKSNLKTTIEDILDRYNDINDNIVSFIDVINLYYNFIDGNKKIIGNLHSMSNSVFDKRKELNTLYDSLKCNEIFEFSSLDSEYSRKVNSNVNLSYDKIV